MKKFQVRLFVPFFVLLLVFFLSVNKQAYAYTIQVHNDGSISVYKNLVLGDDTEIENEDKDTDEVENKQEAEDTSGVEQQERERAQEMVKKREELRREEEKKNAEKRREEVKEKTLSTKNSRIEITPDNKLTRVKIEQKKTVNETAKKTLERKITTLQELARKEQRELTLEEKNQIRNLEKEIHGLEFKEVENSMQKEAVKVELKNELKLHSENGETEIEQSGISMKTSLPIRIDSQTGAMTIVTPAGEKNVTVLPEQALLHLVNSGFVDANSTSSASQSFDFQLDAEGNNFSYKFTGKKTQKFLGIFPVAIEKQMVVSPETGDVQAIDQTLTSKILDLFAF